MGRRHAATGDWPTPARSISVCIPAFNEERNIGHLLRFLYEHPPRRGVIREVLVEVSGSSDGTRSEVLDWASRWPLVKCLDTGRRLGLLESINRLLLAASGDIVVRTDADVQLREDTLDGILRPLESAAIGIVGPRIVPLEGTSRLVNGAVGAEWALHHRVSLLEPKTTVVQAFRRPEGPLPPDSGLEDAALQQQACAHGLRPAYAADVVVLLAPPASVPALIRQRSRTVAYTYQHFRVGYARPPTAEPRTVWKAAMEVIRHHEASVGGLVMFAWIEGASRLFARIIALGRTPLSFQWAPVDGTKETFWSRPSDETASAPPPPPEGP